jgi:hypothetical protein
MSRPPRYTPENPHAQDFLLPPARIGLGAADALSDQCLGRVSDMTTACYAADFLGPLGAAFDRRVPRAWTEARTTSSATVEYCDTDPRQTEFDRLVAGIRERRYDRVLLRWVADLCLTPTEIFGLVQVLAEAQVRVEVACWATPADLFAARPDRLVEFRRRSAVAKVLRLHRAGLGVEAVTRAVRVDQQAVSRTLVKHGLISPTENET